MDISYSQAVENAEALIKLGQKRIFLYKSGDDARPWQHVTNAEPSGTHRLDITTDVRFTALHPCGLTFEWCYDIEPRSANGSREYMIDIEGCKEVLSLLPSAPREQFSKHLRESAEAVRKNAIEFKTAWERAEKLATKLESI